MNSQLIRNFLREQLGTTEAVNRAAAAIGVSQATMYRYKSNPESMQLGHFMKLADTIGFPVSEQAAWLPKDFLPEERHRLRHEQLIAKQQGSRMVVTPYFTVNAELPEITELTAEDIYGSTSRRLLPEYMSARAERKSLYDSETYSSKEIINGHLYADFFHRKNRFRAIPEKNILQQIDALINSLHRTKVHRRIYLGHDLPIITWYSIGVALVRFGEFTIELTGETLTRAVEDVFNDFYGRCAIKQVSEVEAFLRNPDDFFQSYTRKGASDDHQSRI